MPAWRIIRQTEDVRFDDGKMVPIYRTEFMVGDDGPFFLRLPVDGYTKAARDAKLDEKARELAR